jgi:hypothetical protein
MAVPMRTVCGRVARIVGMRIAAVAVVMSMAVVSIISDWFWKMSK